MANQERKMTAGAGVEKSKRDVVNIVHVGEATLAKRVKEFALTTSGDLTIEEFEDEGRALEAQHRKELQLNTIGAPAPAHTKGGCQHLSAPHGPYKINYLTSSHSPAICKYSTLSHSLEVTARVACCQHLSVPHNSIAVHLAMLRQTKLPAAP